MNEFTYPFEYIKKLVLCAIMLHNHIRYVGTQEDDIGEDDAVAENETNHNNINNNDLYNDNEGCGAWRNQIADMMWRQYMLYNNGIVR
jgi:hypothetical protein